MGSCVGIVLCSEKNDAVAKITLPEDDEHVLAARYQMQLPTEKELRAELTRERREAEREVRLAAATRNVGAPVKLLSTREDDVQHDDYRSGGFQYLKAAIDKDPLALRLELLASASAPTPAPGPGGGPAGGGRPSMNPARMRAVLELVAGKSGWGRRRLAPRTALGIASHFDHGGHVAEVAEVTVSADKRMRVNRVWVAADVGSHATNPGAAEHMLQGAVIDGLGEPGLPPILPAVCNAILTATGERIHTLPFAKQGFRFA